MAEGYEPYHVPQQSRRDKLRVGCVQNLQGGCAGLVPLYDPSVLLPSDLLLTCANLQHQQHQSNDSNSNSNSNSANCSCGVVKEEGVNLMGYVGNIIINNASSSSTPNHHIYMDPQSSIHVSPSSIQDMNNNVNPFLYNNPQNLRINFDQSFNGDGGEVVVYKPEPLSSLSTNTTNTNTNTTTHHEAPNPNGQEGLSLSLSSHQHHTIHTHHQSNNIPLELNLQRYDHPPSIFNNNIKVTSTGGGGGGYVIPAAINDHLVSRSSVPLGPFTGYTSILKGSKFLRPAQQLLEELCCRGIYGQKITQDSTSLMNSPMDSLSELTANFDDSLSSGDGRKKSRLISMLDEVYRRYKHYYQQMQAVVASFESVAGLSNAAPYANLALNAMSKHFKCLKNAIADQLQFTSKVQGHINYRKDESPRFDNSDRSLYSQRPVNNSGFLEHQPVWRPQRGLPERAVSVLRAWLFEHFLHPYPTDTDKLMLAKQTGLSRSQVSNWFINARVRLWKPMVEEIHMLETRQASKASEREEQNGDRASNYLPTAPSTSSHRTQDPRSKRTRNDIPDISITNEEQMNVSYDNLSRHPNGGYGISNAGGSGGVSLTLGLHQNNGLVLTDPPFPVNAGQRFGLDGNGEGYVMGGFEASNRQFGRDIMGSQLLHDFVG